jgi:hypothetical protein
VPSAVENQLGKDRVGGARAEVIDELDSHRAPRLSGHAAFVEGGPGIAGQVGSTRKALSAQSAALKR